MVSADPALPPLSLYVHLPWCVRKCPYCDFNSYAMQGELPESSYVDALLADLAAQRADSAGRNLGSVFFGGGTPSLFAPAALERLLDGLRAGLDVAADAEITLEANPGTIEHGRFADYHAAGVNRVSLGAQSFDPEALQRLGRIHSPEDTRRGVDELRRAGVDNFNLDLMYALPGQDLAGALGDVQRAIDLGPSHISHYELTLEPGTVFGGLPPPGLPDAGLAMEMQLACQEQLARAGYAQYEVSAYALEGRQCSHNLNYWNFGDYLGIGAGAHGKLSRREQSTLLIDRTWREREPRRYMAHAQRPPARRTVPPGDLPFEYLMNRLRLRRSFSANEFSRLTGLSAAVLEAPLSVLRARGLVEGTAQDWRTTERGYRFLNDVLTEFMGPAS